MPRHSGPATYEPAGKWCCGEWVPTGPGSSLLVHRHAWRHLLRHGHPDFPPSEDGGRIVITMTAAAYITDLETALGAQLELAVNLGDRIDALELELATARHPANGSGDA